MQYYPLETLEPTSVEVQYHLRFHPLSKEGVGYRDKDTAVTLKGGDGLGIDLTASKPLQRIRLTWETPASCKNAKILGDALERGYGNFQWEKRRNGGIHFWYYTVSDTVNAHAYGVKTGCNCFVFWKVYKNTVTLTCDVRNGAYPVHLNGRTLHLCDVVTTQNQAGETVFQTMNRFCKIMCPAPRLPKAPVYGANNWYYAYGKCDTQLMKMDADLLAETTEGLENRPYCVLDDGWMTVHMSKYAVVDEPTWKPDEKRFPDMKGLTDYIRSKNLIPGIWVRPLITSRKTPSERLIGQMKADVTRYLDPSRQENLEEVASIIKQLRDWGFDLIKHDFSTHDILGYYTHKCRYSKYIRPKQKFFDNTRTTAEIILDFYRTIREAAGDAVVIGCNTVSHLSAGLFELQRTGNDTSGHIWEKTVRLGVNTLAFRMPQHNAFYACDADCIGHQGVIPWKKNRQWLRLLAISGTPLFTSIDPRLVTDEIKQDLKEAYALASEQASVAVPKNWFDNALPDVWLTENGEERFYY